MGSEIFFKITCYNYFLNIFTMKKLIIAIAVLILASFVAVEPASAEDYISGSSAQLSLKDVLRDKKEEIISQQAKREAMKRVLTRYNSPLIEHVDSFIEVSERYELEDYLLISIAGVESSFANRMIPGTHNAYGYGKGRIVFSSWEHGVETVGFKLRHNYINKGAETVEQIGPIYAGGSTTWAGKIRFFMAQFKNEEEAILQVNQYL